ncbi:MAG: Mth938-like domain-containing protein [Quisquiliibacterium sp.]
MKLHADIDATRNTVTAYGPGYLEINRERHRGPVLVRPEGAVLDWGVDSFETLAPAHFERLLELGPELVLLGTGERQRFPHPALTVALAHARIGFEVMDTRAACRTYNILVAEGRMVLAAMLPL